MPVRPVPFVLLLSFACSLPPQPPASASGLGTAPGERESWLLWPAGAPGALGNEPQDQPRITIHRAAKANGAAVVVCPGGAYRFLATDHEGTQVAEWLNSLGVSAFVLQYRLGPRYHHPAPLLDAQRALRLVRARARELAVDPARIGIMGFSAGGHLAATAGTHFDDGRPDADEAVERASSRPDFMILCYPVVSMNAEITHRGSRTALLGDAPPPELVEELSNERRVTARTPPAFLFHTTEDEAVPVANSLAFYAALIQAKVPAELHVFEKGRHGVGLAKGDPALSAWPKLCAAWLMSMGFFGR